MSDQETRPQLPPTRPDDAAGESRSAVLKGSGPSPQRPRPDPDLEVTWIGEPVPPEAGGGSPLGISRGLIAGCGVLAGLGLVAVVLAVLFLPPFNLAAGLGGFEVLNAASPTASHPDGITVTLIGEGPLRLRLGSVPREGFLEGSADRIYPGARAAIPSSLEMKSPLYRLDPQNEAPVRVEIVIPNAAEPYHTLDLYRWDEERGMWVFVPGHVDVAAGVIRTDELPDNVAIFQTMPVTPLIGTTLEPGQSLDGPSSSVLNLVMPIGLQAQADGSLSGEVTSGWQLGAGYAVIPVVRAPDPAALADLLKDPAALGLHVDALRTLAVEGGFNGLAIDYQGVSPADRALFAAFIADLSAAFDEAGKALVVVLHRPAIDDTGAWDTGGYDWRAIGAAADIIVLDAGPEPADYAINGAATRLLGWAVGEIDRRKLHVASSASSYDETNAALITYEEALAALGEVTVDPGAPAGLGSYPPGTALTFDLSGGLVDVLADQNTGAYAITLAASAERRLWIVTANAVRARLDIASLYNVGGMTVNDLAAEGNDPALVQAITEFKVKSASTVPGQLVMQWTVSDASGALLTESTGLGTPWVWRAGMPGRYTVQGAVVGSSPSQRGEVAVLIGTRESGEPTATATVTATRPPTTGTPAATTPAPTTPAATPPPSVGGAGSDGGSFELGGQVPGFIAHPDLMRQAGMRWVKFQVGWYPSADPGGAAGLVGAGHAAGFKVLLSIKGPLYPSSIDYTAYTEYVRGVAQAQPDAIEVWNEMNLNREWPAGQIDPANYVNNMLAPAFNAIKSVSPGTMVIIGALAPTGVDDGVNVWSDQRYVQGLAAAGAARYANCIGVHHNAGATPPSASSGHPAGGHYSWYFQPTINVYYGGMGGALPVCFTEYGYVSPEGYGELPGNFSWGADNTVAEQAAWLAEGVQIARSLGYVRLMIIWNVDFTKWESDDPQAGYAIVRPDGTCPACVALGAVAP